MVAATISNKEIAGVLDHIAELLEAQKANPHRIRAYRNGAQQIRASKKELAEIAESGGPAALQALPGIGESLSRLVMEYVLTAVAACWRPCRAPSPPKTSLTKSPASGRNWRSIS